MISKFFGLLGMLVSTYRYDGDNEHHLKLAKGTVPEQSTTDTCSLPLVQPEIYPR